MIHMRLFKMEVHTKNKRRTYDVIVHAESIDDAMAHVASKFTKCELRHCIELPEVTKHFVVAELETD